jgi:hypothetical protein
MGIDDRPADRQPHPHALGFRGVNAYSPGGDWDSVHFVPHVPVKDILLQWDGGNVPELLQGHVTAKRLEELSSKIELIQRDEEKLRRSRLNFLTKKEKQTIERLYMERYANRNGTMYEIAFYTIKAPRRKKLTFEAWIEDDGSCVDLKTPYDERDGKFTDLSEALIVP